MRAGGKLLGVGPGDLSLTWEEASSLLRNVDLTLGEDDVAELHRAEGWPAGLYLTALCLKEGGRFASAAVSCFRPAGCGPAGRAFPRRGFVRPGSVGPDHCRAAPAADALHHLSFPQIAEEMFLSRHTVKAEAMAIYRKLGASSRSQAVGRARELALLD